MSNAIAEGAYIPLPDNEVRRLIEASQHGDYAAREKLVEVNTRLVGSIVRRYLISGKEQDDLFQAGCIGLLKAIERFDFSYGVCFSTYAVPLIMGEIRRMLRDDNIISISRLTKERAQLLDRKRRELYQEWGRDPELWQLAEACNITEEQALAALEAVRPPLSINEARLPERDGNLSLEDMLPDKTPDFDAKLIDHLALQRCMEDLPPRLAQVIQARYFAEVTQAQLARQMGVSQVQISRLEKQALTALREKMISKTG